MKNSILAGARSLFLTFFAALLAVNVAVADGFPFRVALGDLPGVDEVTSGNIDEGIRILEHELENGVARKDYVLATLCGAYILQSSLKKAERACTDAVEISPGEIALNNRGVLRTFTGDFKGAKEDFDKVRPENLDEYWEHLRITDAGLIAHENGNLLNALATRHSPLDVESSVANTSGAEIETFGD